MVWLPTAEIEDVTPGGAGFGAVTFGFTSSSASLSELDDEEPLLLDEFDDEDDSPLLDDEDEDELDEDDE